MLKHNNSAGNSRSSSRVRALATEESMCSYGNSWILRSLKLSQNDKGAESLSLSTASQRGLSSQYNKTENWGHNTYFDTANKYCFHEPKSARHLSAMRAFACETHTLARGARPDAFASRLRADAKGGRSVASRIGPSEVGRRVSRKRGGAARGFRARRGCGPPMVERASSIRLRRRDGFRH